MENHPIPQDITGFQFKLIGDMTIKQFAYLAAGIILGWIIFILPIFIFIKFPLIFVFVGLGVATAFLPIEGRPFDVMISNYLKALFSPTQYIYRKMGGHIWFPETQAHAQESSTVRLSGASDDSSRKLQAFLKSLPQQPKSKLDEKETVFLNSLGTIQPQQAQIIPKTNEATAYQKIASSPHFIDTPKNKFLQERKDEAKAKLPEERPANEKESQIEKKATDLKKKLEEAKKEEKTQERSVGFEEAHAKTLELGRTLSEVSSQKQALENQILELQKKLDVQNQKIFTPATATTPQETQRVRKIPKQMGKTTGLPFVSDAPNLVMGIIKDPRNNPIPNILVEVKDASGNPVRAFKTNVLGQFASATPLGNGTYSMSFEDPKEQNKFDTVEIKAEGGVFMPIEIISLDSREELRRSLFKPAQKTS